MQNFFKTLKQQFRSKEELKELVRPATKQDIMNLIPIFLFAIAGCALLIIIRLIF